jgi:hypothetical protein
LFATTFWREAIANRPAAPGWFELRELWQASIDVLYRLIAIKTY